MNKTFFILLVIGLTVLGILGYSVINSNSTWGEIHTTNSKPITLEETAFSDPGILTNSLEPKVVAANKNIPDETGWSAFPRLSSPLPEPDITSQINVGNGSIEPKSIMAKVGQQVKITFTAVIRDEVRIEEYDINTYVEPQRESTVQFTAKKIGKFLIVLVKTKKTVGTLIIK
jgi:heme/copper-type cytochrome/quinol oxidase subunit 2